ncbi:MAG: DUF4350 domain-containing protein [Candidatus Methanoperedens sp.]|nr:DUF4350 domain-containing protein [Candidatus Methanoperedens sp.]
MKKINKKILISVAVIILIIGLLRFSTSSMNFSTYNQDWNGGEEIKKLISKNHQVTVAPIRSDIAAFEPNKTVYIILGPKGNFSEQDIEIIKKFLGSGGLLILADDFGSGNQLLNRLTDIVSFSNMLLQDDVSFWKNTTFPIASTSIVNISNITMNYATSLLIINDSFKVFSNSSRFGLLSENESGRGRYGSYPVIGSLPYDRGEILVIADPSIFINGMLPMEDNKQLLEELVGNRTNVIFDDSESMPYVSYNDYLIKTRLYNQYIFAGIIISVTFLYMNRSKIGMFERRKTDDKVYGEPDEEKVISDILKRNKWSEKKLMLFKNKLKEGK